MKTSDCPRLLIAGLIIGIALAAGCRRSGGAMKDNAYRAAWTAITSRDYRSWRGLPADCRVADVDAALPRLRDEYGVGNLGSAFRPAMFRMYVAEGYPFNLRVWSRDERVLLIEMDLPKLAHPSQKLLQSLGEPEARLDYHLDVLPVSRGAWIYPTRGISVFLDVGLTEVMRVAVYPPCSLAEYLKELHANPPVDELPLEY